MRTATALTKRSTRGGKTDAHTGVQSRRSQKRKKKRFSPKKKKRRRRKSSLMRVSAGGNSKTLMRMRSTKRQRGSDRKARSTWPTSSLESRVCSRALLLCCRPRATFKNDRLQDPQRCLLSRLRHQGLFTRFYRRLSRDRQLARTSTLHRMGMRYRRRRKSTSRKLSILQRVQPQLPLQKKTTRRRSRRRRTSTRSSSETTMG